MLLAHWWFKNSKQRRWMELSSWVRYHDNDIVSDDMGTSVESQVPLESSWSVADAQICLLIATQFS